MDAATLGDSARWLEHFRANAARGPAMPWAAGAGVTDAERELIATSVQQFQLGESGEGKHLLACAARHAAAIGDADYPAAARLFVAEEQRHSAMLARFLAAAGLPTIRKSPVDGAFRFLRHLLGLELSLIVLSTAEVVATVYYRALRDATGSPLLRAICQRVLRDEAGHLAFHRARFDALRRRRSFAMRCGLRLMHHGLLTATNFIVWRCHRRVLRSGGVDFVALQWQTNRTLHRQLRRIGLRARLAAMLPGVPATTRA